MALSGSKNFEPDVAEYIEEAFERCGLELRTGYDLRTAKRSANLMLAEWANRGLNQWTIKEVDITMVKDTSTYNIDSTNATAPIDVLDAYVRETINNETTDFPLNKISRAEYANLSVKTTSGKPNQVFVNKQTTPTITVWPVPDKNSTYTVRLNVLTRMDDVDGAVDTVDMPFRFFPCFVAGLAYYISMKKAPERTGMLKQVYEEEFTRALSQDEPRTSLRIAPNLGRYNSA
jgi:hypothetical protein|tara:strand:- start:1267 stop:1962 length:696 start_codon:yes stop_codon:yes gene_type:complete